ncbi:hypothetical protein N7470_005899 [Penicillium chermesinum]|nr:hypothetical protein N7470_005899 [Penicillium chermesinum]
MRSQMDLPPKLEADLEAYTENYESASWLLEDHPLRSHPTQGIPGLGAALAEFQVDLKKHTKWYLVRSVLLIAACFALFHSSQAIPSLVQSALPRPVHPANGRPWYVKCTFPRLDPRPSALTQSAAAGCNGFRTEVRSIEGGLYLGPILSQPQKENDLQLRLKSLSTQLQPPASHPSVTDRLGATRQGDSSNPFVLILDVKSPFDEVYPTLMSQLSTARQEGSLTTWSRGQFTLRQLTVVVTAESKPETYFADGNASVASDVFWTSTADLEGGPFSNEHLVPLV